MTVFSGKGVYGAIAIGKLSIFKKNDTTIKRMHVEDTEAEKARVEAAKTAACEQLQAPIAFSSAAFAARSVMVIRFTSFSVSNLHGVARQCLQHTPNGEGCQSVVLAYKTDNKTKFSFTFSHEIYFLYEISDTFYFHR